MKQLALMLMFFLAGEVSERTPAVAKENDMIYISAGHHATERYGVQALSEHLCSEFNLKHQFIRSSTILFNS